MKPLHYVNWLNYYGKEDCEASCTEWIEYKKEMEDTEGEYQYELWKERDL